jgi:hypothetical protein
MYFPTCESLSNILYSESGCIDWLFENRIIDLVIVCGRCGGDVRLNGHYFHCRSRTCRKIFSIFIGSFFELSKTPCNKIMQIGYYWLGGSRHKEIMRYTGASDKTVTAYLNYFRQLVSSSINDDDTKIGGEGVTVEVDESKFGKRKYNHGHHVEGVWVVGGVERTTERKIFAVTVHDRSAQTLRDILLRHVLPGTTVLTDMWKGYSDLNSIGLFHDTVNHSIGFISSTGVHTNSIEGTWNGIKMGVSARNRTRDCMPGFLLEFIWRRKNFADLWGGLVHAFQSVSFE